jgi:hypothetical protein
VRTFVGLALVSSGAAICIGGAVAFMSLETSATTEPIWPLPGLVLLEWGILGFVGLVTAQRSRYAGHDEPNPVPWAVGGALLSLGAVGVLSIGPFAVLSALLILAGAALRNLPRVKITGRDLRWFVGGLVGNLALLLLLILSAG